VFNQRNKEITTLFQNNCFNWQLARRQGMKKVNGLTRLRLIEIDSSVRWLILNISLTKIDMREPLEYPIISFWGKPWIIFVENKK